MVATLFYVDALPGTGALAEVCGDEGFHAATVRRIRSGERLVLGTALAAWPTAWWRRPAATGCEPGS
ncbi:ribosomal RNA small subunit methyltransferase E domain protein [Mycobacterium xenopi 4042]|uniref:Ribosomal RNA small subunit methyltransferase E domain protein n=1 Tax=Mycobacterium xenopi 4042 TaxID=1299334 RepID=X8ARF6_MYCXE|nr:ribosomal RNA small subunit methyltransferase E domain protein [Mycobacterium xenopi 4042]